MQTPSHQDAKPNQFVLRVALLYVCIHLPNGIHLPYFPLWLEHLAFTPTEIGIILAAPMFVRIFAGPAVSAYADRANDRVPVLIATAFLAVIFCAGYLLPHQSYPLVLAVSVLLAAAWAPQNPLSDSIALSGVRRFGADYASMRVWGSISFLVASFACGYFLAWTSVTLVPMADPRRTGQCRRLCIFCAQDRTPPPADAFAIRNHSRSCVRAAATLFCADHCRVSAGAIVPWLLVCFHLHLLEGRSAFRTAASVCYGPWRWRPKS
jgi:hypothetical protein